MKKFKIINLFSFCLTIPFICSIYAVSYHSSSHISEYLLGIPIFLLFIVRSKASARLVNMDEISQSAKQLFSLDIFLINYGFYLSSLMELILQHNNIDLKSWWLVYIYFSVIVGFIFSLFFASTASLMGKHKNYTIFFTFGILLIFSFIGFLPLRIQSDFLNGYDTYWVILAGLLIFHTIICLIVGIKNWFTN